MPIAKTSNDNMPLKTNPHQRPHPKNLPSSRPPCSYSVPSTQSTGPALNAIATPDDQTTSRARHLRQCEHMAELGMALVEGAHREALREFKPPPPRRAPLMPGLPNLPDDTPYRSTKFNELFVALSHCVRQAILLEARLEAGFCARPIAPPAPAPTQSDEPAAPSGRGTQEGHPRLTAERLQDDLAADAHRSPEQILAGIAEKLDAAQDTGLCPNPPAASNPKHEGATEPRHPAPPPRHPPPCTAAERAADCYHRRPP